MRLELHVLPDRFAACQLPSADPVPAWVPDAGSLVAVARTPHELSIICEDGAVPKGVRAERGFRALVVRGPLPFDAVGILAGISSALKSASSTPRKPCASKATASRGEALPDAAA